MRINGQDEINSIYFSMGVGMGLGKGMGMGKGIEIGMGMGMEPHVYMIGLYILQMLHSCLIKFFKLIILALIDLHFKSKLPFNMIELQIESFNEYLSIKHTMAKTLGSNVFFFEAKQP